jgi:chemotaxis response regulator CheB
VHGTRPAAENLFESAAKSLKERIIAVVLTGADGDGESVRTVKQMRHAGACRAMNVNVCLIQDLLTF